MKRSTVIALLASSLGLMAHHCQPHKQFLITPLTLAVPRNTSFEVQVETRNLGGMEGFAFVVTYDPARLQLDGAVDLHHTQPSQLSIVGPHPAGKVVVHAASTVDEPIGANGNFIATVRFRTLSLTGPTALAFERAEIGWVNAPNASNKPYTDARLAGINDRIGATITVQ